MRKCGINQSSKKPYTKHFSIHHTSVYIVLEALGNYTYPNSIPMCVCVINFEQFDGLIHFYPLSLCVSQGGHYVWCMFGISKRI